MNAKTSNLLVGWLVYPAGDLAGQAIMGDINLWRTLIVALAGGIIYRWEVPAWFRFLDRARLSEERAQRHRVLAVFFQATPEGRKLNWMGRTLGAMGYFNPLWIARHAFFLSLAGVRDLGLTLIVTESLKRGAASFVTNLPLSVVGNYLVQQKTSPKHRFFASATLTGVLTIKYAIEHALFK